LEQYRIAPDHLLLATRFLQPLDQRHRRGWRADFAFVNDEYYMIVMSLFCWLA
jgi:hypothetical protein